MSLFGDYESYKKFLPAYNSWKYSQDKLQAQRLEYLKQHPELRNENDMQRGRALLRAIDIMDEFSQKRAEDMEVATNSIINGALEIASLAGAAAGFFISKLEPVQKLLSRIIKTKNKNSVLPMLIPTVFGAIMATFAAFPLMAWGAKAEVAASRRGRFQAMREDLKNPAGFAVLTLQQQNAVQAISKNIKPEDKKKESKLVSGWKNLKEMAIDSKEYKKQKKIFDMQLAEDQAKMGDDISEEESLAAKKDQQILNKLVEKIDIASQDYAEDIELACDTLISGVGIVGILGSMLVEKILNALKVKSASKISAITKISAFIAAIGMSIAAAEVQKQASRVGRFKVKQELMQNPDNFIYVDDNDAKTVGDVALEKNKKPNIFVFLLQALKNNREYKQYQKTVGKSEQKYFKAMEKIKLSPQQQKDAERLQKNTFRVFNKVDEKSQQYAENVEARGQAISYPITLIASFISLGIGMPFLLKNMNEKNKLKIMENWAKYFACSFVGILPAVGINFYITKEQKKASRVADMLALKEMNDYRFFR